MDLKENDKVYIITGGGSSIVEGTFTGNMNKLLSYTLVEVKTDKIRMIPADLCIPKNKYTSMQVRLWRQAQNRLHKCEVDSRTAFAGIIENHL